MIKAVDLRKGKTIMYEGKPYVVHESQHVAKGNKRSYMQTKLKGLKDGTMMDVRFSVDDRVETPFVEDKPYEYLYRDGDQFVLMDPVSFEQTSIAEELVGDMVLFLKDNLQVSCQFLDGEIISMELPHTVELAVTDTPPAIKGATATNQNKEAMLETGAKIKVPPFVEPGEVVRVDTRNGEYIERVK